MAIFTFWVRGRPCAVSGIGMRQGRKGAPLAHNAPLKLWRESIEWRGMDVRADRPDKRVLFPLEGPVALVLWFWLPMSAAGWRRYKRTGVRPPAIERSTHSLNGYVQAAMDGLYDVVLTGLAQVVVTVAGKGYVMPDEEPGVEITAYAGDDLYAYATMVPPVPPIGPVVPEGTPPARRGPRNWKNVACRQPPRADGGRPPLYWFDGIRLCRRKE